jgi:hypothetical protein
LIGQEVCEERLASSFEGGKFTLEFWLVTRSGSLADFCCVGFLEAVVRIGCVVGFAESGIVECVIGLNDLVGC